MNYNNNHSYDFDVKIEVDPQSIKGRDIPIEDIVRLRISPSCDSNKIHQSICNHDFKTGTLDYKHLPQ